MDKIIERKSKKDRRFDALEYVLRAKGKNGKFEYLYIESGVAMATDGVRMHIATIEYDDLPDGIYDVVIEKKNMVVLRKVDDDIEYINYELLWKFNTHNGIDSLHVPNNKKMKATYVLNHILRKSDHPFDCEYLLDACWEGDNIHFRQCEGKFGPIEIRNALSDNDVTRAAIIAPLKF